MRITSITASKIKPIQREKIKYSIRFKLLSIVTSILVTALIAMIFLVTLFYKHNSEILIQEYNLSLSRLTGSQLESNLKSINYKIQTLTNFLMQKDSKDIVLNEKMNQFFKSNPNYIFFGLTNLKNSSFAFEKEYINDDVFNTSKLDKSMMPLVHDLLKFEIKKLQSGINVIVNASEKFSSPVLCLMIPSEINSDYAIVLYFSPTELFATFQSSIQTDIFQVFMINEEGKLILHSDPSETILSSNKSDIPIVKKMLTNTVNNGSQKYIFNQTEYLGSYQMIDFANLGVISTVESDKVFEAIYQIQRRNFLFTIIILTISFLIIYIFANSLTAPLLELVNATEEIERGNFEVVILPKSKDEVGQLTTSFTQMAKGLKERENIKNTFGKFVNKDIAEKALHGELQLGGVKKRCAIFFSDLRNFTGMSESLEAEVVVGFLNQYFSEMVECVYETNGIVDKFIGDAIMAHWGAIYSDGNDTESAIETALLMRQALLIFNLDAKNQNRPIFRFGCGINTGDVIAGQIGSLKKLEYTVIGDAVNLASRIEYLNKQFGTDILISEFSYEEVKHLYDFVEMEAIQIRGKAKPQKIFAVLGKLTDLHRPKNLEELRKNFGIQFENSK